MSNQILLKNSKRRYEKRCYTPLIIANQDSEEGSDALGMAVRVRSLMLSDNEVTQLKERLQSPEQLKALDAMANLSKAVSAASVLDASSGLISVSRNDLKSVSVALGNLRSDSVGQLTNGLQRLDKMYANAITQTQKSAAPEKNLEYTSTETTETVPAEKNSKLQISEKGISIAGGAPMPSNQVPLYIPAGQFTATRSTDLSLVSASLPKTTPAITNRMLELAVGPALAVRTNAVLSWVAQKHPAELKPLLTISDSYLPSASNTAMKISGAISNLTRLVLLTELFSESLTQRPLQPIGLLYLERLEMTPLAVERGELSYSLPLAPNEKVTLAHREWSVREEQYSEFIEDYLENYSEQGVAQTDDIALSTTTQTDHNNALSMSQPLASASGVHVTSPLDTTSSATVDDTQSKEESKSQSRTVTALASTRTMKDHKISFTVTTVSGMEDFTAHLIENKHDNKSMRIDYFKRVRHWQSDLYRYGVRLTYDVVLPDPGARLREREVEIQQIADELAGEFQLYLTPSQIQPGNWELLADQYGVTLPSPPEPVLQVEATQQVMFSTPYDVNTAGDGTKWTDLRRVTTMSISIAAGYQLSNLNVYAHVQAWPDEPGPNIGWLNAYAGQSVILANRDAGRYCDIDWNLNGSQVPSQGQLTVLFRMQLAESGILRLTATTVPLESNMESWRMACWSIIRDAATAKSAQHRSYLRDRQSALQKQINNDDPVRLRRMEREAIMYSVLDWLFPGFQDASSILGGLPSPGDLDPGTWQQVMQYGEYIKFVQTSIDWDNVMVFLYPYFWDTVWHEQEKLFLYHPDAIHREFLRAGAARVILAIQPGFEQQVVSLLDQGQLGNLPDQSRFQQAVDYVNTTNAAFAKTTTGGGTNEDPKEPGILIGSWTDYTPTSALDIDTTIMPVLTS